MACRVALTQGPRISPTDDGDRPVAACYRPAVVLLLFALALLIIVGSSELFTNAVEWTGFTLHLGSGATGSLLAAIGTAMPETTVPIVALIGGAADAQKVATGAVLGAPLLLLTLGVAITGVAVALRRRQPHLRINVGQARRDLGVFVGGFSLVFLAMALPKPLRLVLAAVLVVLYVVYVVLTLRGSAPTEETPEPLHLLRWREKIEPPPTVVVLQLLLSVAGLILGSKLFVDALDQASMSLGISALLLAIVLVPFATELPETFNSVLWVRSGDDGLAFGNIAGAAAFQACILGAIGLAFTSWNPGGPGVASAALTLLSGTGLLLLLGRRGTAPGYLLVLAGLPWLAFVVIELLSGSA